MLFNSWVFAAFLAITFAAYYLPGHERRQVPVLILASLVFYSWYAPWLLLLLLTSIGINVTLSRLVAFQSSNRIGVWVVIGLIFNIGLLACFKYGPLLASTLAIGNSPKGHWLVTLPLPIGISFYTFESISLLVDLVRGRRAKQPPFIPESWWRHTEHTSLFVAFFPHLISGPILKANQFYPQISPKRFADIPWDSVFRRCVQGYFLKLVVSQNLNDLTNGLSYPQFVGYGAPTLVALLFAYAMEIFADFAGYSLIAIGLGLLFGYRLPENFNFPYVARSISEFWRRWHMSLSSWLREYLYYPLGGNRRGPWRTYFNLLLVMTLGGLWHGAAWSFAIWGLFHGLGLAAERLLLDLKPDLLDQVPNGIRITGVFGFVMVGWLFFKLTDIHQVDQFLTCLRHNWGPAFPNNPRMMGLAALFSVPVVAYHVTSISDGAKATLRRHDGLAYGILLAMIVLLHGPSGRFIYFQF